MSRSVVSLQDAVDRFARECVDRYADTLDLFAEYLVSASDLVEDSEDVLELDSPEWERVLEESMEKLLDGDIEPAINLEDIAVGQLDVGHVRDFLAWFLLREADIDSLRIHAHAAALRQWFSFLRSSDLMDEGQYLALLGALQEVEPEAVRACQAALVLLHHVRQGSGVSSRIRRLPFDRFLEGHARVIALDARSLVLGFDNIEELRLPLPLPENILRLLRVGDVIDIELGWRGGIWQIVDSGPLYPSCVYMEADGYEVAQKVLPDAAP